MLIASQVWEKTCTVFICFQNLHLHLWQAPIHLGRIFFFFKQGLT